MAQPPPYSRDHDFALDPLPEPVGDRLNEEYDDLAATVNITASNLGKIQRDDTKLANGSVHPYALSDEVVAMLNSSSYTLRGFWVTATAYAVGDIVEYQPDGESFLCAVAHTSGDFATDRAAGNWLIYSTAPDVQSIFSASSGSSSAYTANMTPPVTVFQTGDQWLIQWHTDCVDDPTLDIDSTGAKKLFHSDDRPILAGDLRAGMISQVVPNATRDVYVVHTHSQRMSFISVEDMLPDDTNPGVRDKDGPFAFWTMATGQKMWLPPARYQSSAEDGASSTVVPVRLWLQPTTTDPGKAIEYVVSIFIRRVDDLILDVAASATFSLEVSSPAATEIFTIESTLTIPNLVAGIYSVSVERITPTIGSDHTGLMRLLAAEIRP